MPDIITRALLESKGIPTRDIVAAIWGRKLSGGYEPAEATGTLPLTFRSNGTALIDYRIYGNTVETTVKTANLVPLTTQKTATGSGITVTIDSSGVWHVTGTASQDVNILFDLEEAFTVPTALDNGGEGVIQFFNSVAMDDGSGSETARVLFYYGNFQRDYMGLHIQNRSITQYSDLANMSINRLGIWVKQGITCDFTLSPMVVDDGIVHNEYVPPEITEVQGVGVKTENLYNKNDPDIVYSAWMNHYGGITLGPYGDAVKVSGYIPINGGKTYIGTNLMDSGSGNYYSYYDANKQRVGGTLVSNNMVFNSPINAAYIRTTLIHRKSEDIAMITEGSTAPDSYIPYGYKLPMVSRTENLYDYHNDNFGYFDINGQIRIVSTLPQSWSYSEYISVVPGVKYIALGLGVASSPTYCCIYDKNKNLIDTVQNRMPNTEINVPNDGAYVRLSIRRSESEYLTAEFIGATDTPIYIGDAQLMKDAYVSYGDQAIYKRMVPENTDDTVIYGFHVNPDEADPADAVTYLEDAVGMTPAAMGSTAFNYGSWANAFFMPKPCMLKFDGTVDYYLDPNDYSKKLDGTDSDYNNLAYEGNAMMEWPLIWYKFEAGAAKGEGYFYVSNKKVDDSYQCWCNYDSQNHIIEHFYTAIYNGCTYDGKMRSISGLRLTPWSTTAYSESATYAVGAKVNYQGKMYRCTTAVETAGAFDPDKWEQFAFNGQTTGQKEIAQAMACNTTSDTEWYIDLWADRTLITGLLYLMGKSLDLQSTFGRGLDSGSQAAKEAYVTGALDDKGLFWGVTANGNNGVKVFGMENFWGCVWHRTAGLFGISTGYAYKLTHGTADGSTTTAFGTTSAGYNTVAVTKPAGGWVTKMLFGKNGMLPIIATGGSASTYECDYYYNGSGFALVGGGSINGLYCGFYVSLYFAVGGRDWNVAAALSCKPLAKLIPTDPPVPLPELPTFSDTNTVLDYEETPAPEEVWVKYQKGD